jgi:hypothetical protein
MLFNTPFARVFIYRPIRRWERGTTAPLALCIPPWLGGDGVEFHTVGQSCGAAWPPLLESWNRREARKAAPTGPYARSFHHQLRTPG